MLLKPYEIVFGIFGVIAGIVLGIIINIMFIAV